MADKDGNKEIELEPVGPGAEVEDEDQTVRDVAGEDIRDDRDEEHTDPDESDERVAHSEDDEEGESGEDRERIRARRRQERKQKKEEQRRAHRELNFLRQRNEVLERRQSEFDARIANSEVTAIDTRIQALETDIRKADDVYAEAINKGDGQSAAEAQRIRDQLRDGVTQLQMRKQGVISSVKERIQGSQNRPDPEIQTRAQEWISENPWFDPNGADEDSAIAKTIENRLFNERGAQAAKGEEYWDEYNRRLKKRLPHLFERDDERDDDDRLERRADDERRDHSRDRDPDERNDRDRRNGNSRDGDRPVKRKSGGPRFTSGGRERPLKKNEVYVSEERRKAMEEAGVWEDEKLRNRYLKSYQNWDADARRNRH